MMILILILKEKIYIYNLIYMILLVKNYNYELNIIL